MRQLLYSYSKSNNCVILRLVKSSLWSLSTISEEHDSCEDYYCCYNPCQNSDRQALYEEVCKEYTDNSEYTLANNGNHVESVLLNELWRVTKGHQVCAGSHHDWECSLYVHAKNRYQSQARSIESAAKIHESAKEEVNNNTDDQLSAFSSRSFPVVPKGPTPSDLSAMMIPRRNKPMPIPRRTVLRSHLVTKEAPTKAPTVAATSIEIRVSASTSTSPKNRKSLPSVQGRYLQRSEYQEC